MAGATVIAEAIGGAVALNLLFGCLFWVPLLALRSHRSQKSFERPSWSYWPAFYPYPVVVYLLTLTKE